jgi:hypothetical protein
MGFAKKRTQASSAREFRIVEVPVRLSEEDDDERLKRLSKKILDCVQEVKRGRKRRPSADDEVSLGGNPIEQLLSG